ncbi:lipoyl domain-containing protein [Haloplanus sp. GCM10025708]|uniref:lipoyl domain-containing protein n=1 Tax=Haloferacaceae TaxID=1644056 RepID=UPI003612833C
MTGARVAVDSAAVWPEDTDEDEGVVSNWFVREGARIEEGDVVCEIQVEKVSVDVPAPATGELDEIAHGEGDEFRRGDALAWVTT